MKKYLWSKHKITQWSYGTFIGLTKESQLKKLEEELNEAADEHGVDIAKWRQEMADVSIVACILEERFHCPIGFAVNAWIETLPDYHLIMSARDEKMEINQTREWHFENGVFRH